MCRCDFDVQMCKCVDVQMPVLLVDGIDGVTTVVGDNTNNGGGRNLIMLVKVGISCVARVSVPRQTTSLLF